MSELLKREKMARALFEVGAPPHQFWDDVGLDKRELYLCMADAALSQGSGDHAPQVPEPVKVMPRAGSAGVDWWGGSVKLYRQNQKLRKALQEQHNWHLSQGDIDVGGGITLNGADEYGDSGMYERTVAALDAPVPQSAASTVEPVAWPWGGKVEKAITVEGDLIGVSVILMVPPQDFDKLPAPYKKSAEHAYAAAPTSPNSVVADYATTETPEPDAVREKLKDPTFVHLNMLAGSIAKPSWVNIQHLYPDEFDALARHDRGSEAS